MVKMRTPTWNAVLPRFEVSGNRSLQILLIFHMSQKATIFLLTEDFILCSYLDGFQATEVEQQSISTYLEVGWYRK